MYDDIKLTSERGAQLLPLLLLHARNTLSVPYHVCRSLCMSIFATLPPTIERIAALDSLMLFVLWSIFLSALLRVHPSIKCRVETLSVKVYRCCQLPRLLSAGGSRVLGLETVAISFS